MCVEIYKEYDLRISTDSGRDLKSIILGERGIAIDELHVLKDSEIGNIIASFPDDVSFTIKARNGSIRGDGFIVGYILKPKLVYPEKQDRPLAINPLALNRIRDRFSNPKLNNFYEIRVFSPGLKSEPDLDWGVIRFDRHSPDLKQCKRSGGPWFEDLFCYSDDVPNGELHVRSNSEAASVLRHAERMGYIEPPYYVRLMAEVSWDWGDAMNYFGPNAKDLGIYPNMRIVYVRDQEAPLSARRLSGLKSPHDLFGYGYRTLAEYVEIDSAKNLEKRVKMEG